MPDFNGKVLIAGWYSFPNYGGTAGDVMVRDVVCDWLSMAGIPFDVAVAPPLTDGIAFDSADPADYSAFIFTCGPFGNSPHVVEMLDRFKGLRLFGVNLSFLNKIGEWNPFELLLERDSDRARRPDLALLAEVPLVPVVGVILVHPQKEYGTLARHQIAGEAVEALLDRHDLARLKIDTLLEWNAGELKNTSQIVSMIARTDFTITTRLHGLVLSLRHGIPAIAIDAISGGAKVTEQAKSLDWPLIYSVDDLDADELDRAVAFCRSEEARKLAAERCDAAKDRLEKAHSTLIDTLLTP